MQTCLVNSFLDKFLINYFLNNILKFVLNFFVKVDKKEYVHLSGN